MLDLARGKMLIADQSVTLVAKSCSSDTQCSCVILLENCFIPPCSEVDHIVAKENDGTWLVEGIPSTTNKVMVARTFTRCHGQSVVIWIVNTDVSYANTVKLQRQK